MLDADPCFHALLNNFILLFFGMHRFIRIFLQFTLLGGLLPLTSKALIQSGPLLGHVDMREANICVELEKRAEVRIAYVSSEKPDQIFYTDKQTVSEHTGYTATLRLSKVEPQQTYSYQIEIDGKLHGDSYSFKTPAFYHDRTPPPDFRIAIIGDHYAIEEGYEPPYQILGGGYDIFSQVISSQPDLTIWTGNTASLRPTDLTSLSGYRKRFSHARQIDQLQPLITQIPNYAVWGQTDYGPSFPGRAYSYRSTAEQAFSEFWPRPTDIASLDGIATRFSYADVDFFLLDVNSYRDDTPNAKNPLRILGPEQIEWLRQELIRSNASFKIIVSGSPMLNPANTRANFGFAEREQTLLLEMLREAAVSGLFFVSCGKGYGEMTKLVHANSYNLYDLTVGPTTGAPLSKAEELNFFRIPGTSTFERHFAVLEVNGPEAARQITIRIINQDGNEMWTRNISRNDLQTVN